MNPIDVGHELKANFKDLLETQFPLNPNQAAFQHLWKDFFSSSESLVKGPYLQMPLPFKKSKDESELTRFAPAMDKLQYMPYCHQSQAFDRISAPHFKPTLVATGTGSGKTECFSYPILSYCAQFKNTPGIRAIIIYPMNALATDQARRLAETIDRYPGLKGVNVGLYIGDDSRRGGRDKEMGKDHVITDREAILQSPPQILLTNYKMLDYMLLREKEKPLWAKNNATTLKYLVVDELHTFDGAQAADLACLVRRLKLRLRMEDSSLCCVGTSATLGSGDQALKDIRDYAGKIFSREFDTDSVIPESRIDYAEMKAIVKDPIFDDESVEALFALLNGQVKTIDEVAVGLSEKAQKGDLGTGPISVEHAKEKLRDICSRLSELRATRGRDYPEVRLQYWMRELARMVVSLPRKPGHHPHLEFSDDLTDPNKLFDESGLDNRYADTHDESKERVNYFPVGNCNCCGSLAWTALLTQKHDGIEGPRKTIYEHVMDERRADDVVYVYPVGKGQVPPFKRGMLANLCPKCLAFKTGETCDACHAETIPVLVQQAEKIGSTGMRYGHTCPYCGADHGHLLLIGMRAPTMLSTCISAITTSKANTDKKIIAFSDNVQDTSHRAGFFGGRTWAATFRGHVAHYFHEVLQDAATPFKDFSDGFWNYLLARHGGERREIFGELIPQDLKWLNAWAALTGPKAEAPSDADMKRLETRIKWELAVEFGYKSGIGRTLSKVGICELRPKLPLPDAPVWAEMCAAICNKTGTLMQFNGKPWALRDTVLDIATRMIASGAFDDGKGVLRLGVLVRGGLALRQFEVQGVTGVLKSMDRRGSHVAAPGIQLGSKKLNAAYTLPLETLSDFDEESLVEIFDQLAARGIVEVFEKAGYARYWYLSEEALMVAPCSAFKESNPFRRQYLEGDVHRLNAEEHTGMLKRDERENLEKAFKSKVRHTWHPNLISATPTLEMGVDIGDLSSVLLCSVPPTQSQFIQRMGRSGRANGSALNVTVANAKPHDLYFFKDPREMISGAVTSPGVFLDAVAILSRQYVGYALSEWMLADPGNVLPQEVGNMLAGIKRDPDNAFPRNFFVWYKSELKRIYQSFHKRVSGEIDYETAGQLQKFAFTHDEKEDGLIGRFSKEVSATTLTLKNYLDKRDALKHLKKEVEKDPSLTQEKREEMMEDLYLEAKSYQSLANDLRSQRLVEWLSDTAALLPNYAFPEPGVSLQSVLWRKESKTKPPKFEPYEISRPASSGLTELVPGSEFFGHGHHVTIDQVDLQKYNKDELEKCEWRFCPNCDHIEPNKPDIGSECPVCHASWVDGSQVIRMIPTRQFISVKQSSETLNDDASEQRKPEFYDTKKFFERKAVGSVCKGYVCQSEDVPFGFEYVSHLIMREVNFGKRGRRTDGSTLPVVNADPVSGLGFTICPECGKSAPSADLVAEGLKHTKNCSFTTHLATDAAEEKPMLNVGFYRQYETEALRIFVPTLGSDDEVVMSSFMAALQLGLKEYFRGQVDHLAMEVQSLPDKENEVRNQYVILYDGVPGGTGYLKQFVSDKDQQTLLFEVLELALKRLKGCECGANPEKDGCYHCLYRFRDIGGRQNVSRKAAIKLLSDIVPLKGTVKAAEGEGIYNPSAYTKALESELERKFDARLREFIDQFGDKGSRKDGFTKGFVPGMQFTIPGDKRFGGDEGAKSWEVVPQQEFGPNDGALVCCKPDFVFYPLDEMTRQKARPVAVFTDGWLYHKDISDKDVLKRMSLMKAGFRVWSLAWNDVAKISPDSPGPQMAKWREMVAKHPQRNVIGSKYFGGDAARANFWNCEFNATAQEIDRLFAYLRTGDDEQFRLHSKYEAMLLALPPKPETSKLEPPTGWAGVLVGDGMSNASADGFEARIVVRQDVSAHMHVGLNAVAELNDETCPTQETWQSFFGFATYFQFLDAGALFYTRKSKADAFWQQTGSVSESSDDVSDWTQAFADVEGDPQMTAVLKTLKTGGISAPVCFQDYEDADMGMTCNMWLKWESEKVCVVGEDDASPKGWTVVRVSPEMNVEQIAVAVKGAFNHG